MQIFIHSADTSLIYDALRSGYVYGVTTNPTVLRRQGISVRQVTGLVHQVVGWGAEEIHLHVYADTLDEMMSEARELSALDAKSVVVRLPATQAGYGAARRLSKQNVRVSLTSVYTVRQAMLAQSVGADYITVFLKRMNEAGIDGMSQIAQMQQVLTAQQSPVKLMAASMREAVQTVEKLGMLGVGACAIPPSMVDEMLVSEETERSVALFRQDAEALLMESEHVGGD
jgi:transaldolase